MGNIQELKRLFNNNPVHYNPKDIQLSFGLNENWIVTQR